MSPTKNPRRLWAALLTVGIAAVSALSSAQSVVAWGSNWEGESVVPVGLTDVIQISANNFHALALKSTGKVVAWGRNTDGQCNVPASLGSVKQVVAAVDFSYALRNNGTIVGWGKNEYGQLNVPAGLQGNVVQLASGGSNVLALKSDGTVVGWGYNGNNVNNPPEGLTDVVEIASSYSVSLARKSDGTVVAWGSNFYGGLDVPAGLHATKIAANWTHCLALRTDGTVAAWGQNNAGQSTVPAGLSNVVDISCGHEHSLAVKADGTVVAWGYNNYGQINVPAGITNAKLVAGGNYFSVALAPTYEVEVNQSTITGGGSATGKVRLPFPAGPGGVTVDIAASNNLLDIPATVTVPEGQTTRTFPVHTDLMLGPGADSYITISHDGVTNRTPNIRVQGTPVTFAVEPALTVSGGTQDMLTATVTVPTAPTQDLQLGLESSDPNVNVPATITLPAGQTSVVVNLTHSQVTADRDVTIRLVSENTTAATSTFRLRALIGSVFVDTLSITSGQTATGSVRLSGRVLNPLNVALSSSNVAITVPASVTVPAGANWVEFPVSASGAYEGLVTLTASINGQDKTTVVYVGAAPQVTGVDVPSVAYGWNEVPIHITLAAPAPAGGARVRLTSTDLALKVPSYAWVPEGATSVDAIANTSDVRSVTNSTVKAEIGATSATDTIEVRPLVLKIDCPDTVVGGQDFTLTLSFDGAINRNALITIDRVFFTDGIPEKTTLAKGVQSRSYLVHTGRISVQRTATITAHWNGQTFTKTFTLAKS